MARMTKAEKLALQESFMAQQLAEMAAEYPEMLMTTLTRINKSYEYEMAVRDSKFVVTEISSRRVSTLTYSFSQDAYDDLRWLSQELDMEDKQRLESERLVQVRKEAMSKLTAEEQKALGL